MYICHPAYPTPRHEYAAKSITGFFSNLPEVKAVLLTCSCARGKATSNSCLDISILLPADIHSDQKRELEIAWDNYFRTEDVFKLLLNAGKFANVDLDFSTGLFQPGKHGWTSGPDEFELEIGNLLAYSVVLWEKGHYLQSLKAQWLPYYADSLRKERLAMVRRYCLNNLNCIQFYIERGLYFQAFHRLYNAFGEFLQALFISKRIYPIAYDKWIKEQIVEILELPELYERLPGLFEISRFESDEIFQNSRELTYLLETYVHD